MLLRYPIFVSRQHHLSNPSQKFLSSAAKQSLSNLGIASLLIPRFARDAPRNDIMRTWTKPYIEHFNS